MHANAQVSKRLAAELEEVARRFCLLVERQGWGERESTLADGGGEDGDDVGGGREGWARNAAFVRSLSMMHRLQRASSWRETVSLSLSLSLSLSVRSRVRVCTLTCAHMKVTSKWSLLL